MLQGLKEVSCHDSVGLKRMGELDSRPFLEAMKKKKYNDEDAKDRALELCSLWEEFTMEIGWYPFTITIIEGKDHVCLT